ncbi:hypothetical protein GCM10010961_27130 [Pseudodonghicola xiamenensis]|uniref:HTH tetR-type domain-containing protein n=2 Tax=Pseudodonghicola xiamenensis TaxID=337702 RepID=A0A8J3H6W4_9RHOB|nr:hypothetical protein GCM10010961_27130 [Pseudodonghicola xiamenensis]
MRGATVQEICRRAHVTTGAIQHHFGSKTGLIAEVVKSLFRPLTNSIASSHAHGGSLEERVTYIVDHFWSIYGGDRYFAMTEVVLSARNDPELMDLVIGYRNQQLSTLEQHMSEAFRDVEMSLEHLVENVQCIADFLRGYALRRQFFTGHPIETINDHQALAHARSVLLQVFQRHRAVAAIAAD